LIAVKRTVAPSVRLQTGFTPKILRLLQVKPCLESVAYSPDVILMALSS
jgi:hypothetical protein